MKGEKAEVKVKVIVIKKAYQITYNLVEIKIKKSKAH